MTTSNALSALRHYLHDERLDWDGLTHHILSLEEEDDASLDIALDYAEQHLSQWPDAQRLIFQGYLPTPIPATGRITPVWPLARTLYLNALKPADALTAWITSEDPRFAHLTGLTLVESKLKPAQFRTLGQLQWTHTLRRLGLRFKTVTDKRVRELFSGHAFPHLNALDLSHNAITPDSLTIIRNALERPGQAPLKRLSLSHCDIGGDVLRAFLGSACAEHITHLDVSQVYLGPAYETLTESRLPNLTHLTLQHARIKDAGAAALASAPWIGQLTHLDISYNRIHVDGLNALLNSELRERLVSLRLFKNPLRVSDVHALARADLPRLRELDLRGQRTGDAGAQALANAPWLPQLTTLYLDRKRCTADALAPFRHCLV